MTSSPFTARQVDGTIRAGLGGYRNFSLTTEEARRKSATYRDNLTDYRNVALRCLNEGDYRQAAEKTWGAYAQAVKLAGAAHGMHINSHSSTLSVAQELTYLAATADVAVAASLDTGFHKARSLHQHFYENDLRDATVERAVADVMDAIDLLQTLFGRG